VSRRLVRPVTSVVAGAMASPAVSAGENLHSPKFMLPVTVDSVAPHPLVPFQPDASQVLLQPLDSRAPSVSEQPASPKPHNILAAAKRGDLGWVKQYADAGQTELADSMGEVCCQDAAPLCSPLTS
jgi:hypothetical protein